MRKIIVFLILLAVFFSFAYAQEISVVRSIPQITSTNQEFKVSLQANIVSGDPSGLIISETIPQGWAIVKSDDCVINQSARLVKCLTYGQNLEKSLSYTLKSPSTKPSGPAVISGQWKTLTTSGNVEGGMLEIVEPLVPAVQPEAKPPTAPDYTLLIILGVVAIIVGIIAFAFLRKKKAEKR